jgi:quercetin dioxygenase-like cupin family protein
MRHTRTLPFATALLLLACTDGAPPESYPDAVAADPDHYTVEFENDAVRLLRIRYAPGESSVIHHHPATCSIALSDMSWAMTDAEGEETESTNEAGAVSCGEGNVHLPENNGSADNELVLIEFKDGATPGATTWDEPDAVSADPAHYSVEFENEVARVVRIRYENGEAGVLHRHPANCVVWLTDAATTDDTDGEAPTMGSVSCSDTDVHTPTGSPGDLVELVAIEFKGREALQN